MPPRGNIRQTLTKRGVDRLADECPLLLSIRLPEHNKSKYGVVSASNSAVDSDSEEWRQADDRCTLCRSCRNLDAEINWCKQHQEHHCMDCVARYCHLTDEDQRGGLFLLFGCEA